MTDQRAYKQQIRDKSIFLAPDDLEVGMYVSIERNSSHRDLGAKVVTAPDGTELRVQERRSPNCYAGIPHKIIGISWPNLVLSILYPGGLEDGPVILRIPEIRMMRLDDSYVEAICTFVNTKKRADEEVLNSDNLSEANTQASE